MNKRTIDRLQLLAMTCTATLKAGRRSLVVRVGDMRAIIAAAAEAGCEVEDEEDMETCEGCSVQVPADQMKHDDEGVPLCEACWRDLVAESRRARPARRKAVK